MKKLIIAAFLILPIAVAVSSKPTPQLQGVRYKWKPDVCLGTEMVWESGDNWNPAGRWGFTKVCAAYAGKTREQVLAQVKAENQAMSFARARLVKSLNLPAGEEENIRFSFDAARNLTLTLPSSRTAAYTARKALTDSEARAEVTSKTAYTGTLTIR